MLEWLRKRFRKAPPKLTDTELSEVLRRREEKLPCCGMARISHATFRSGQVRCPVRIPWSEKLLKYDPLAVQFECFPSNTEPQWDCDRCKCKRGVHMELDTGLRGACTDPDCPGCVGGCYPP